MCTMPVSSTAGALGGPSPSQQQTVSPQSSLPAAPINGASNNDLVSALQSLLQMLTQLINQLSGSSAAQQPLPPTQPNPTAPQGSSIPNGGPAPTGTQTPTPNGTSTPVTTQPQLAPATPAPTGVTPPGTQTPPPPPPGTTNGLPPTNGGPMAPVAEQSPLDRFASGWSTVISGAPQANRSAVPTTPTSGISNNATGANPSIAPPTPVPVNGANGGPSTAPLSGYQGLVAAVGGASSDTTGGWASLLGRVADSGNAGIDATRGASSYADTSFVRPGGATNNGATSSDPLAAGGFLWKGDWYRQIAPIGGNMNNMVEVELRVSKSTLQYLIEDEGVTDFALNKVESRRATEADVTLLKVNPNAMWVSTVTGTYADGRKKSIPVVTNYDGTTWVDPPLRR